MNFELRELRDQGSKSDDYDASVNSTNIEKEAEERNETSREESSLALRRSSRVSTKPKYLEDYELLCEEDDYETLCEIEYEDLLLLVNEEPWKRELKIWRDACEEEIKSIEK